MGCSGVTRWIVDPTMNVNPVLLRGVLTPYEPINRRDWREVIYGIVRMVVVFRNPTGVNVLEGSSHEDRRTYFWSLTFRRYPFGERWSCPGPLTDTKRPGLKRPGD